MNSSAGKIDPYQSLLDENLAPEEFVRRSLQRLEAEFRTVALLALTDWVRLKIVSPELFSAVAALQRPSWGMWNGLLRSLEKARNQSLRNAGDEERERIESATLLSSILTQLDLRVDQEVAQQLKPLSELTRSEIPRKCRLSNLLTIPISLRNRVAHDAPTEPEWWQSAADSLRPLIEFSCYLSPLKLLEGEYTTARPWFLQDDDQVWTFNGLANDMAVIYVSPTGESRYETSRTSDVVQQFQQLLGKTEAQESDFRRLLTKLAPEEIKGVILDDYIVGKPVGEGGFATVHIGRELNSGRKVAIKILRDGHSEKDRERFRQEARFLSQVDHPHIVSVFGFGEETWSAPRAFSLSDEEWFQEFSKTAPVKTFIAMEWVDGATLDEVISGDPENRPSHDQQARWFSQAASALSAVHLAGLVHRDIKPSNLMIDADRSLKLMDFGIARQQDDYRTLKTTTGQAFGTPAYMSPEQIRSSQRQTPVGPPTDVYSLCATFYEVFTQRRLFDHDTASLEVVTTKKLSGEKPVRPRTVTKGLPWELETILMGGLESDAKDRYESMEALRRDIDHFRADEPIEYRRPSLWRRMQLGYRRNRLVSNLVAMFLVAAVFAGVMYLRDIKAYIKDVEAAQLEESKAREREHAQLLETQRQLRVANATALAADAIAMRSENPRLSLLTAVESVGATVTHGEPVMPISRQALIEAVASSGGHPLTGHTDALTCLEISQGSGSIALGCRDGTVSIWDARSGNGQSVLSTDASITSLLFHPSGLWLAAGNAAGQIYLHTPTGETRLIHHDQSPILMLKMRAAEFEYELVSVCEFGDVRIYSDSDLSGASDKPIQPVRSWAAAMFDSEQLSGNQSIFHAELSESGRFLATTSFDAVRVWDLDVTSPAQAFRHEMRRRDYIRISNDVTGEPPPEPIAGVAFDPTNHYRLVTATEYDDPILWMLPADDALQTRNPADSDSEQPASDDSASGAPVEPFQTTIRPDMREIEDYSMIGVPSGRVTSVKYGPRGERLAISRIGSPVELWKIPRIIHQGDIELIVFLRNHHGGALALDFDPTGVYLLTGGTDGKVIQWDLSSRDIPSSGVVYQGHAGPVNDVRYASNRGFSVSIASVDQTARYWPWMFDTGQSWAPVEIPYDTRFLRQASFAPDGSAILFGTSSRGVDRVMLDGLRPTDHIERILADFIDETGSLIIDNKRSLTTEFSPDGRWAINGCEDGQLYVISLEPEIEEAHDLTPVIIPDGTTEIAATDFTAPSLGDIRRSIGKFLHQMKGKSNLLGSASPIPASDPDIMNGQSPSIDALPKPPPRLSGVRVGSPLTIESPEPIQPDPDIPDRAPSPATPQEIAPRVSQSGNSGMRSSSPPQDLSPQPAPAQSIVTIDGTTQFSLSGHSEDVRLVLFNDQGNRMVSAGYETFLWAIEEDGRPANPQQVGTDSDGIPLWEPTDLAFSHDDKWLAIVDGNTRLVVLNLNSDDSKADFVTITESDQEITSIAFSPDGKLLASAGTDDVIRLWKWNAPDDNKLVQILRGHVQPIRKICFSPDGHWLASASDDTTARLFDMHAEDPTASSIVLRGHRDAVIGLSFRHDSGVLLTESRDQTIRLWELRLHELLNHALTSAGASMTLEEWQQMQVAPFDLIEDFESGAEKWTFEGTAFQGGPVLVDSPGEIEFLYSKGLRFLTSFESLSKNETGTATSPEFTIQRRSMMFLFGGTGQDDSTRVELIVDGKVVRAERGQVVRRQDWSESFWLRWGHWDIEPWIGKTARIRVTDSDDGPSGGFVCIDHIMQTDWKPLPKDLKAIENIGVE